ncbi:hypothetical protein T08_8837 [Trichinella sp. T8]|nr:hypothetical protein T08_8837 [Trichinella sp. T8]
MDDRLMIYEPFGFVLFLLTARELSGKAEKRKREKRELAVAVFHACIFNSWRSVFVQSLKVAGNQQLKLFLSVCLSMLLKMVLSVFGKVPSPLTSA